MTNKYKGTGWDEAYKEKAHWEGRVTKAARNLSALLNKKDKILEIGCGSGDDSIFLAKKDFQVWGIDISKLAIKKAKSSGKLKNLRFSLGDVENLKFKDDFFGGVLCMWVLHSTTANLKKGSKEIHRVLKKGGISIIGVMLNMKYYDGKIEKFKSKKEILDAFKNFKIIKKMERESDDKHATPPHKHDIIILYLKK